MVGWEGRYEVSDHGRVRSLDRIVIEATTGRQRRHKGRIIKPAANVVSGHLTVCLPPANGEARTSKRNARYYVHRLVLEAFVGPAPSGLIGCHDDDDPSNNRLGNLAWGTRAKNVYDYQRNRAA